MDKNHLIKELRIKDIVEVKPFNEGWSDDEKFIVTNQEGEQFLLRVNDKTKYIRFKKHFNLLQYCNKHDVPTHKVISFGYCLDKQYVYILMAWINATDLDSKIKQFPVETQYDLGLKAGKILQTIHRYPYEDIPDYSWDIRFNKKIDNKIKMYQVCDEKYENGEVLIDNIKKYRHLLKNREIVQHHGDFHIGNILVDENETLYIIDFDRHDIGEPIEEFNRIVWCSGKSPAFAAGRIDGYFNHDVPQKFFELLLLYITTNTLSSLPWAVPFGDKQVQIMKDQYKQLLWDYDHFNRTIPRWYTDNTFLK